MQPGRLHARLSANESEVILALAFPPGAAADSADEAAGAAGAAADAVVPRLAERLGWVVHRRSAADGLLYTLQMTRGRSTVLVVDDNEGLGQLFERFVADHACRVVQATSGAEGLRMAQEMIPDAVVLDVMMPKLDGWEVLQTLRAQSATAEIPVIICSVITDQQLAASLGAVFYLPKPITRESVLEAFRSIGLV